MGGCRLSGNRKQALPLETAAVGIVFAQIKLKSNNNSVSGVSERK